MGHTPQYVHADYLGYLIPTDKLRETVRAMSEALKPYDFDALAFTGVSGMLIGPPIAMALDKSMLVVRKERSGHSSLIVEGDLGARRYVFVDECIASGDTYRRVKEQIEEARCAAECIGALTYWNVMHGRTQLIIPKQKIQPADVLL